MADQQSESDNKPSFTLRAGLAACISSVIIGVSPKVFSGDNKDYLQTALLVAPFLGQLTASLISIPIQYGLDSIDHRRYNNNIVRLHMERKHERTSEERKRVIDIEIEHFEKEIFRLRSKSIVR